MTKNRYAIVTLLLLISMVGASMAQTTLFNLPQQVVGPFPDNAPFVSSNFTVPSGITTMKVLFNIIQADLQDTTKSFVVKIIRNSDGLLIAGFSWQGGSPGKDGVTFVNPSITFTTPPAGQQIHAEVTMPVPMTTGLTITGQ